MKTRRILAAALLCLLLLCACGKEETPAPTPAFVLPEGRELAPLTPEESRAMARFLNANRVCLVEGRLYCYDFDENWEPVLARCMTGRTAPCATLLCWRRAACRNTFAIWMAGCTT